MEQKENNEKKPVVFVSPDYVLPFYPFQLNNSFAVTYTIEKNGKTQILEQNFDLRWLEPDTKQNDYHFIETKAISSLLINGERINTRAYKMAEKTAELLHPLRIVVNKYGKWKDLNSYSKLKERWENQKDDIQELFDGKIFMLLVQNIENAINDDKHLVGLISGNWFLRAYFNGIHRAYKKNLEREMKLYFPVIAEDEDTEFLIVQKANLYLNDKNQIEVMQSGVPENEFVKGTYNAKYYLNPVNYIIERLYLECDLTDLDRKLKVEVKIIEED